MWAVLCREQFPYLFIFLSRRAVSSAGYHTGLWGLQACPGLALGRLLLRAPSGILAWWENTPCKVVLPFLLLLLPQAHGRALVAADLVEGKEREWSLGEKSSTFTPWWDQP